MNITKFVNLKVCAAAAFSCAATVGVQHWRTSESIDNVPPPMRKEPDERQKKFEIEVQQRSEELLKREEAVKASEEAIAKREAALKEERLALQYMQGKNNVPSEGETVAAAAIEKEVSQVIGSEVVKIVNPAPVEKPNDYVPRRPQVFDGGGNREPKDATISVTRPLYFNDPSFTTDSSRYDPARDMPPHLADTSKRRRYTDLKPQHVVSFRATKDGWSLKTPDNERSGGSAVISVPETRTDFTSLDAAGAPRKIGKSDATVVTLYGSGDSKSPFGDRSRVSEAERNAFNEEKRLFARQKKDFEQAKGEKEKELAEKKQALDDREAELEHRDNAADFFDLEEREMQRAERQKAKYKANTKVQHAQIFNILRKGKEPYVIARQDKEGMTIKAKPKDPNILCSDSSFEIAGTKQSFEDLTRKSEDLFIPRLGKKSLEMSSPNVQIFLQDDSKKEFSVQTIEETFITLETKEKTPLEMKKNKDFIIAGKKQPFKDLEQGKGELLVSGKEKEPLSIKKGEALMVLPKKKASYMIEKQPEGGMTIERVCWVLRLLKPSSIRGFLEFS